MATGCIRSKTVKNGSGKKEEMARPQADSHKQIETEHQKRKPKTVTKNWKQKGNQYVQKAKQAKTTLGKIKNGWEMPTRLDSK